MPAPVYLQSGQAEGAFCGCGALVEGPFVVTCRHVWLLAARGTPVVRIPSADGEGTDLLVPARLADGCEGGAHPPDLVILSPAEGGAGFGPALPFVVARAAAFGSAYAVAGLYGREAAGRVLDVTIDGTIDRRVNSAGLRQFTGTVQPRYWLDRGSSGSPVLLAGEEELAGLVRMSETGASPGAAPIHEAFVIPATTIHRHLRALIGREMADARGIARDKMPAILDMLGAAEIGVAELRRRLALYFDNVAAAAPAPPATDGAIAEARRLSAAFQPATAMAVLDAAIAPRMEALADLLEEKAREQALVLDHAGRAATLGQIAPLRPDDPWVRYLAGDELALLGRSELALQMHRQGQAAAEKGGRLRDVAVGFNRIGDVLRNGGDWAAALEAGQAELRIVAALAAADPADAALQRDLSIAHERIGVAQHGAERFGEARASFEASLAIRERLAALAPADLEAGRDLASAHAALGRLLRDSGNTGPALAAYDRAIAVAVALGASADAELTRMLAKIRLDCALLLEDVDDAAALADTEAALRQMDESARLDPDNLSLQQDRAVCLLKRADFQVKAGDAAAALESYRAVDAVFARLVARDPGNADWQRNLSVNLNRIGHAATDPGERLRAHRAALAIAEQLARREPGHALRRRDQVVPLLRIAALDDAARADCLARATVLVEALRRDHQLRPQDGWMQAELSTYRGPGPPAPAGQGQSP